MTQHLIVGFGEVGQAVASVLCGDMIWSTDLDPILTTWQRQRVDVIHVCVPFTSPRPFADLIAQVRDRAPLTIVHSTVPLGTCDRLGVCHSPIRGVHPYLTAGLLTFVKYFGGTSAADAAAVFARHGVPTRVFPHARTTEAIKLWDTTQYGFLIQLEKDIYAWCVEHDVDFEVVYRNANRDYNAGYIALGRPEVVRPWLQHVEGPIGGHCVIPNATLLGVELRGPTRASVERHATHEE